MYLREGKLSSILNNIKEQTNEICLKVVEYNGLELQFVKEQTNEICLEAVKQNGLALKYVKEQTNEICLEAVKRISYALEYVKTQTKEMCLIAIRKNSCALKYVVEQDEEICLEAVKQNGEVLEYVKTQTKEICLEAVKQNGEFLEYVKTQTKEICLEAVKRNINSLIYVNIKYTKFIYNYLKSIKFKKLCNINRFIITKDVSGFKIFTTLFYRYDMPYYINRLTLRYWGLKYIKQSLELCKFVINDIYYNNHGSNKQISFVMSHYINFKKLKLCLQIIKTCSIEFKCINKQYITSLLL